MYVFHSHVSFLNQLDTIKKAWSPTVAVPRFEAFALPFSIEQQREAHAEYKYSPCYIVKVRVCACIYAQKT